MMEEWRITALLEMLADHTDFLMRVRAIQSDMEIQIMQQRHAMEAECAQRKFEFLQRQHYANAMMRD